MGQAKYPSEAKFNQLFQNNLDEDEFCKVNIRDFLVGSNVQSLQMFTKNAPPPTKFKVLK